jgi:AmmeMemoRadiSam system protein B
MLTSDFMAQQSVRPAAVAGSWYPGDADRLRREVQSYLDEAPDPPAGTVAAIVAPHAGLLYSGPTAACSYRAVAGSAYDAVVLVGPSHYVGFDGVALPGAVAFATPAGLVAIDDRTARDLQAQGPLVHVRPAAHAREHSLEMQLPFLQVVLPGIPVVPLVMGLQTAGTVSGLARTLATVLAGRRVLLVASTDLSHFFDAETAAQLDGRVVHCVERFDAAGIGDLVERYPEHERGRYVACGAGPMQAVMQAARSLGARDARVLRRTDSSEVSGDASSVVGYLSAAFGVFDDVTTAALPQ